MAMLDTTSAALPLLVIVNDDVVSTLITFDVATRELVDTDICGWDCVPVTVAVITLVPAVPQSIEIVGLFVEGTASPVNLI